MEEKLFFNNSKGQKLVGILTKTENKSNNVIILVHGYSSNKNSQSYLYLSKELLKLEIDTFRIDLDGCGESEGKFEDQTISSAVDDISSAIEFMKTVGYSNIYLSGSSGGGLAIMATALEKLEIKGLGLLAPVSDYVEQRKLSYGIDRIEEWKEKGYLIIEKSEGRKYRVNYSFFKDAKNHVMYDKVNNIKCPVMIIHGDKDESVPLEQSQKVITEFPMGELIIVKGGDHHLKVNDDYNSAREKLVNWFDKLING